MFLLLFFKNRNETRTGRRKRTIRHRAIAAISLTPVLDRRSRQRPATTRPVVGVLHPLAHLTNASHRINRCLPMLLHPCLAFPSLHPPRPAHRRPNSGPFRCMSRLFPPHFLHPIPLPHPKPVPHTLGINGQVARVWSERPKLAVGCDPTTIRRLRARPLRTRSIATEAVALRPARHTCPPMRLCPLALCPARRVTIVTVVVVARRRCPPARVASLTVAHRAHLVRPLPHLHALRNRLRPV